MSHGAVRSRTPQNLVRLMNTGGRGSSDPLESEPDPHPRCDRRYLVKVLAQMGVEYEREQDRGDKSTST